MLEITGVSKLYDNGVWALKDLSLDISSGVTGLIGPNGAGKTTLMKILSTLAKATEGKILWQGHNIADFPLSVRKELGYLPQEFGVYPHLTAGEFLNYLAAAKGLSTHDSRYKIEEVLEQVNLSHVRDEQLSNFSGGMKQRVGIAQALLNDPKLLIVDEPTAGLDPEERARFRQLISDLSGNRVIILSTHIISDIETTASNLAFVNEGKLLLHAAPTNILGKMKGKVFEMTVSQDEFQKWRDECLVIASRIEKDQVVVRYSNETRIADDNISVSPTLEDAYLYMLHIYSGKAAQ